jgi:hypothetical protein
VGFAGSRVLFSTAEQMVSGDGDSAKDIYALDGGVTSLVSDRLKPGPDGVADATFDAASTDGTRLIFHSTEQLVNGDTDGSEDVYVASVVPDSDGDGTLDNTDNCVSQANASQLNTDHDSQGDACDSDDDNDGVADGGDNCSTTSNASQANSDVQGGGDACDADDDNDGLPDSAPSEAGAARTDRDSDDDGLGDFREVKVTHTGSRKFDTDADGISDGVELGVSVPVTDPPGAALGTNPSKFRKDLDPKTKTNALKKDTDGDKRSDGVEDKNHNGRRDAGETNPLKKD